MEQHALLFLLAVVHVVVTEFSGRCMEQGERRLTKKGTEQVPNLVAETGRKHGRARARAPSSVLPVPGGPVSSTPEGVLAFRRA